MEQIENTNEIRKEQSETTNTRDLPLTLAAALENLTKQYNDHTILELKREAPLAPEFDLNEHFREHVVISSSPFLPATIVLWQKV